METGPFFSGMKASIKGSRRKQVFCALSEDGVIPTAVSVNESEWPAVPAVRFAFSTIAVVATYIKHPSNIFTTPSTDT